jgi:phospholipid/cholesterol/gamma-HCH transport system substrate-binding protein
MKVSREFWLGALVIFVIAVVYFGINFLKGSNLFLKHKRYYSLYENVAGIAPSSPVVLNGYKIGQVKDVHIFEADQSKIVIELSINDEHVKIPKDSKFQIYESDLFGGKAVRLILGDSVVFAENKDTLTGTLALGLTESLKQEIEPLKAKTIELISGIDSAITQLNQVFRDPRTKEIPALFASIQRTLRNVESSTASFSQVMNQSGPDIVQLLNSARSIADNLKNNNGRLSQVIANFEQISDTLKRANVGATILKVNQAVTGLNQVVNDINEGKGTIGALMKSDALHNKLTDAAQSLDVLIDDIQKNPKRYLSFSVVGRKESEGFSKKELEEIRKEINNINLDKKKP